MEGPALRILLDTSVFFKPAAMAELRSRHEDVVLPAVAFAERARQLRRDGRALDVFLEGLQANHIMVEPFGHDEALRRAQFVTDDSMWKRHSRDALIAGHVKDDDQLWTANPRDFIEVGVPSRQIMDISGLDDPKESA